MEGWLGTLIAVSLVLAAAPAAAVPGATGPPQNVETAYEDGDLEITWDAPTDASSPIEQYRVYANGQIENVTSETRDLISSPPTDTVYWITAVTEDGESLPSQPVHWAMDAGEGVSANPCVQIYPEQIPPVVFDPDCLPDTDDGGLGL